MARKLASHWAAIVAVALLGGALVGVALVGMVLAADTSSAAAASTLDERRAYVAALDPQAKERLLRALRRFENMPGEEQQRLRKLHAALINHPQRAELEATMNGYFEWLKTLTPYERAELAELPNDQRIDRIKELHRDQERRRPSWMGMRGGPWPLERHKGWLPDPPVSRSDMEGFTQFLSDYAARHEDEFLARLSDDDRRELREISDPQRRWQSLLWRAWRAQGDSHRDGGSLQLDEKDLAELRRKVSPELAARLANMPRDAQREMVSRLARFLLFSSYSSRSAPPPPPPGSEQELANYLETEVRPEIRDHLLNLPPEEMQKILWLMYWRSKLPEPPGRDSDRSRGGGGPRGDGSRLSGPPAGGPWGEGSRGDSPRPEGPRGDGRERHPKGFQPGGFSPALEPQRGSTEGNNR